MRCAFTSISRNAKKKDKAKKDKVVLKLEPDNLPPRVQEISTSKVIAGCIQVTFNI